MIVRTKKALNFYISNAKQYHQRIPHSNGQSSLPSLFQYSTNTENSNTSMQSLAVVTHPSLLLHDIPGHPESPSRLKTILDAISNPKLMADQELCSHIHIFDDPPQITRSVVALAHPPSYVDYILDIAEQSLETNKIISLDSDTALCPHSMSALMFAPASVTYCIDLVLSSSFNNETIEDMTAHHPITCVLCFQILKFHTFSISFSVNSGLPSHFRHTFAAIRPPGHHAEYEKSMGFCIFNNIFIGAKYAQLKFAELENNHQSKIAIIDFDVHHGNGTQQLCWDEPDIMYISCHQFGDYFFPGTGDRNETGAYQNIINIPMFRCVFCC